MKNFIILFALGMIVLANGTGTPSLCDEQSPARQDDLVHAVTEKNLQDVESLIERFGLSDLQSELGKVLVYRAARNPEPDVLQFLLEKGADVEAKPVEWKEYERDSRGTTPLFAAADAGRPRSVKLLLRHGADVRCRDDRGRTPLFFAVGRERFSGKSGDRPATVRALLDAGAEVNIRAKNGTVPLHLAVRQGDEAVVRMLVEAGADLDARAENGLTALSDLAINGFPVEMGYHYIGLFPSPFFIFALDVPRRVDPRAEKQDKLLRYLVEAGADVNRPGLGGVPPTFWLAAWNDVELLRRLAEEKKATLGGRLNDGGTMLHLAAGKSGVDVVRFLLDRGAELDARMKDGATPILYAAAFNPDPAVFELLLEKGANLDLTGKDGLTILHAAARNKNLEPARILLKRNVNVNAPLPEGTFEGETPLHWACLFASDEMIRLLVAHGADVNAQSEDGRTALFRAASRQSVETVRFLLDHGGEVNAAATYILGTNIMPIHEAVKSPDSEVLRLLIERGAEVNAVAEGSRMGTPLYNAVAKIGGTSKPVRILLQHGADQRIGGKEGKTPLHFVAKNSENEYLTLLLEALPKDDRNAVDLRDKQGRTPLHLAAEGEPHRSWPSGEAKVETIRLLLDHGADINAETKRGETPFTLAVRNSNSAVLRYLIERKAKPPKDESVKKRLLFEAAANDSDTKTLEALLGLGWSATIRDENGRTLLFEAAKKQNLETIRLLCRLGLKVEDRDLSGRTPLHDAVSTDSAKTETVRLLLELGADADAVDKTGASPLHAAVSWDYTPYEFSSPEAVLRLLVDSGAKIDRVDNEGRTPLHIVSKMNGNRGGMKFFLDNGVDPESKDKHGNRPLHLGAEGACPGAVRALLEVGAEVNPLNDAGQTPLDRLEENRPGRGTIWSSAGFGGTTFDPTAETRSLLLNAGAKRASEMPDKQ